jgi:GAF domain-containing protein
MEVTRSLLIQLLLEDGSLFGTLCAIDARPKPAEKAEQDMLEMAAELLSATLQEELRADRERRRAELAAAKARPEAVKRAKPWS